MKPRILFFFLLASLVRCDPCPDGYEQAPNGGNCFQSIFFYDYFTGFWQWNSFDGAEQECNSRGGGMLASIHSAEEEDFAVRNANKNCKGGSGGTYNIGLRCTGASCKWDDGSPVTYLVFPFGGPPDDSKTRCYSFGSRCILSHCKSEWQEKDCGPSQSDCWICSVKARTIECEEGETEYKGGCVSVHKTPLDFRTAATSCPGGGNLVSTHGYWENNLYQNLAVNAGVNGTVYIGGQFVNNAFQWIDGSHYDSVSWASSFPNTIFGSCVQMLLASEFGNQGQWTNIDCNTKQPYMCFRDGADYGPALPTLPIPQQPLADAKCPPIQYYTGAGKIFSPNFPLSIPDQQSCEYVIGTEDDKRASISFTTYDCQSGTYLEFYDGLNSYQPFLTFTSKPPTLNHPYSSSSNVLKIIFIANGTSAPLGTGWQAEFNGV